MAKMTVPYLEWRDGRPRWNPGPRLKARGFKGQDLKSADGAWLSRGAAMDAAEKLNAATRTELLAAPPPAPEKRTVAALFARIRASGKFSDPSGDDDQLAAPRRVGLEKLRLAPATRDNYLMHMNLLERWCGDVNVTDLTGEMIEEFYFDQAQGRGLSMANAMLRILKLSFNHAINKLRWVPFNPVNLVDMADCDGRLEIFDPDQMAAIIGAADWCGLHSIGDAFVVGVLAGQRKADLLALPEGDLTSSHYVIKQRKGRKRGATAYVPITAPLLARVTAMRRRKKESWPGVRHTLEIIATKTGKPYAEGARMFDDEWRLVRAVASGDTVAIAKVRADRQLNSTDLPFTPAPSVAAMHFADTRDTAVTLLCMAGCSVPEIANITGHSLQTVQRILDKHYFKRNAELAISAGVKLDAYLATSNIRWA